VEAFASRRAASVQRAATKARAVEILETVDVDVLMLDIGLPDGSGAELLGVLAQKPVFTRVIDITGSTDPTTAFALAQAGVRPFISKPLNLGELERAWEQALKERRICGRSFARASAAATCTSSKAWSATR
jgi:DNA-binding NarL/FixJ family response regulator